MSAKTISCSIKGISPLLMHRFPLVPIKALEKKSPEEQAEVAEYRNDDGKLYIPGLNLQRALVSGGLYSKGKGRASLSRVVAACVFVSPEHLILDPQKYVVDVRSVVMRATKGRVLHYRPRFDEWSVSFNLQFDSDLLTEEQMRGVADDTGSKVGVLDFRPERSGSFGRFVITKWKS